MRGIWENVLPGVKLEVENRDVNHSGVAFWFASVMQIHGNETTNVFLETISF